MNDSSNTFIEIIESKGGQDVYFGKHYKKTEYFFVRPVNLKTMGIVKVNETNLSQETVEIDQKQIRAKCMKFPIFKNSSSEIEYNSYVVYPTLHYLSQDQQNSTISND